MMKKHYLVVITLFALVVSACRLTVSPLVATSTPGPTETPSPLPTFTPLPTPTPTPTPIPEVRIDRADHFLFLGDYDRALEEYQLAFLQALTDEERAVSLVGMGQVYFLQDRYQEAIDAFKTVLDVYPEGYHVAKSIYYLAQTSMAMGNYLDAAGYYERFLELKPGLLDFYVQDLRGDALSEAGQLAEAISAYQSAVDASGVDEGINIEIKMARAYAQTGDLETAIRLYMEIFEKSSDDYARL
jgi:tetratricopeptide (TPR) repeat protein